MGPLFLVFELACLVIGFGLTVSLVFD